MIISSFVAGMTIIFHSNKRGKLFYYWQVFLKNCLSCFWFWNISLLKLISSLPLLSVISVNCNLASFNIFDVWVKNKTQHEKKHTQTRRRSSRPILYLTEKKLKIEDLNLRRKIMCRFRNVRKWGRFPIFDSSKIMQRNAKLWWSYRFLF